MPTSRVVLRCFEAPRKTAKPLSPAFKPKAFQVKPKRYPYSTKHAVDSAPHHLKKTNTQFSFLPIKSAAPRFFCLLVAKNLHFSNRSMVQRQGTIGTCSSPRRNDDDALTRGGTLLQGPRVTCGKATRATS